MFNPLSTELMKQRLAPPRSGPVRLLIDTDTANEIDDQYALAWALLSPEKMTVEAITAEPFSFAHHKPELLVAEKAIDEGDRREEYLVGGFQGWIDRLHAQGRRADELEFTMPPEGMGTQLSGNLHHLRETWTITRRQGVPRSASLYAKCRRHC